MGRNSKKQYHYKQDAFISVQESMSDHFTIACQLITNIQMNIIIIHFCIPHIASDINMTIADLIQILVLMLLFIIIHREIAIIQFVSCFLYKIYDDKNRHIILGQR
jgi:hypothetical protein